MEEKGGLKYRLFFLGVLLATSVALSVASGIIEEDLDDIDDIHDDDFDSIRDSDVDLALIQILAVGVLTLHNTHFVPCAEAPCPERQMHNAASEILKLMDLTVDPCDDFYQFSCGNWDRTLNIPESKLYYSRFTEAATRIKERLKDLLQKPCDKVKESSYIRKAKNFYQSCVDEEKLNEKGAEPLMSLLRQLGTWPLISPASWNSSIDLESLLGRLSLMHLSPLIRIIIAEDARNRSQYITYIDQGVVGMGRRNMLEGRFSTKMMIYEKMKLQQAVHVLGLTLSNNLTYDISDVVDFEIKLVQMTVSRQEHQNVAAMYKKLTVSELTTLFPEFDWKKYLSIYFDAAKITVTEDTEVVLYAEDYIRNMLELYKTTDKRIVANYLLLDIVSNTAHYLSKNIRELAIPLLKVLKRTTRAKIRWRMCVDLMTNDYMPAAVNQLYVSNYFISSSKSNVLKMIHYIKQSLKQMISDVQWMDYDTKIKNLEQIDKMTHSVGYPDFLFNDTAMEELYKDVDYQPDTYFQNVLNKVCSMVISKAKNLQRNPSEADLVTSRLKVNAYYSKSRNRIFFHAGILQSPFYREYLPMSMNFGAIGVIIAHEIMHGFHEGHKQDKNRGKQVWSKHSFENYKKLVSCFVDQYSKQEFFPGMHVNGNLTLGENIADNGGVKAAFSAFQQWQSDNGKQPDLDLGLSHEQLFFVSFAQTRCILVKDPTILSTSKHSPSMVRVRMSVSNSEDFAKAFNCSIGSNMNPSMKCVF